MHDRFNKKIVEARKCLEEIEEKKTRLNLESLCDQQWLKDMKEYRNITSLDRKIVSSLIEKVVVYSKDRIEIIFRYADEMESVITAAEALTVRNNDRRAAV